MRIRHTATGQYANGPDGPVPEGWERVDAQAGPLKPAASNTRAIPLAEPAFNPQKGNPFQSPQGFFGPGLISNLLSKATGVPSKDVYDIATPPLEAGAGALASIAVPGAGPAALSRTALSRILTQAGVGGGMGALRGAKEGVSGAVSEGTKGAAWGAGAAGLGEMLRNLAGMATHTAAYKALQSKVQDALERTLSYQIPAWKGMSLHDMTFGRGQQAIDSAFKAAKNQVPAQAMAGISPELSTALGLSTPVPGAAAGPLQVSTRDLIDALPRLKDPVLRHAAWDAIDSSLGPLQASGAIQQARQAYRIGKGWYELASRGKFFDQENFMPEKFREAVMGPLMPEELAPRGMRALGGIATKAMPNPINAYHLSPWTRMSMGAGAGGALGTLVGLPGMAGGGAIGGAAGLKLLPHTVHTGVPYLPPVQMLPNLTTPALQGLGAGVLGNVQREREGESEQ